MSLTRDPGFPAEIADLMAAFNRCADGHSTVAVLEASANMLIAAISGHARAAGRSEDEAIKMAKQLGADLPRHIALQWNRQRNASDIDVPLRGGA